jgi:[ribosomal protein S18]-alanine N-acetyltransferase
VTELREATWADLEAVSALDAALFGVDGWSPAAMAAEFAFVGGGVENQGGREDDGGWNVDQSGGETARRDEAAGGARTVLVLTSGPDLVGYAILLAVGDVADVQRIGIAVEWQGRGLGGRLLEELEARAFAGGCRRVLLEVAALNASALALYRRHGFVEIARRSGYYRDGDDAIVMARDLISP